MNILTPHFVESQFYKFGVLSVLMYILAVAESSEGILTSKCYNIQPNQQSVVRNYLSKFHYIFTVTVDTFVDPKIMIIGGINAGTTTLANVLIGEPPECTDCLFPMCPVSKTIMSYVYETEFKTLYMNNLLASFY